jgi:hypothetical protein
MAKLLGLMIGQPVVALQQSGAGFISNDYSGAADKVLWRDYVITNNNVIGDQISLGWFGSASYLDVTRAQYQCDNMGGAMTLSFGDATHPAGLRAAFAPAFGTTARLWDPALAQKAIMQPLWQRLGWAADPGGMIELLGTIGAVNPTNARGFGWQIFGRRH